MRSIISKISSSFMNLLKSVILTIFHQFEPKHDVAHLPYVLWIDNSTPMYALGDTAWTRGRISTKRLSNFMNLQKSVILTIFHRFDPKHDVAHLQYVLYPYTDG